MITPAWLLLIWSGLAAACFAAVAGVLVGGEAAARWSLAPVPHSRRHGALWSLGAGVLIYPVIYGVAFELMQRADLLTGGVLGLLHAIVIFIIVRRNGSTHQAIRAAVVHLMYGIALGFLYVTP